MSNLSLKLSSKEIQKIKDTFKQYIKDNKNEYIDTFIQKDNITISIYNNNKVVFQGQDALFYGQSFIHTKFVRQAGSDEVGTGDYFGPVVVCGTILEEENEYILEKYNIKDSKKLSDDQIISFGEELIKSVKNTILILDNEKYNEIHKNNNLNQIKAKMHNQAYLNLIEKGYKLPNACYVDDFCGKNNYYKYLINEKDVYHNLIFETKAEDSYPSVAVSSCIARYVFLTKIKELEKKYKMTFHKGAGDIVNEDAKIFISKYGEKELNKVAKIHFKNTKEIINN